MSVKLNSAFFVDEAHPQVVIIADIWKPLMGFPGGQWSCQTLTTKPSRTF